MPRKPRMYLPGIPAHVVQRGNNRDACFFADEDYRYYLSALSQGCQRYDVHLHAYCLMTNHVHLLMTQQQSNVGISQVMQHVGRMYVAFVNKTYRRTGTLWEGRHKASLVDADDYLLTCYRYIELNPVLANIVTTPDQYRWSSYRYHAWGENNTLIKDHILFDALGSNQQTRQKLYRELFRHQVPEFDVHEIRQSLAYNHLLGDDRFKKQIESALGRRIGFKERGRPRTKKEEEGAKD